MCAYRFRGVNRTLEPVILRNAAIALTYSSVKLGGPANTDASG